MVDPRSAGAATLHAQIYSRLRDMIEQGRLQPGQRVASLRVMAVELGVARGTVQVAFDRLIGEGYLVPRGPAGTFVAENAVRLKPKRRTRSGPVAHTSPTRITPKPSSEVTLEAGGGPPGLLQLGVPALDEFPRKLWTRLMARQIRHSHALNRPDPYGYAPLRAALASYLQRARGIELEPAQLFVVPSYQSGLELTVHALALVTRSGNMRGAKAWVETPGYPPTAQLLRHLGLSPSFIPVDEHGLDVSFARKTCPEGKLAVVTPSHQSPTGVALSLARRIALLEWAAENQGWIVEDDYDGEFRYRGHPLPALKSLDAFQRVIYCGTLSKVMFPGLRLAYVVAPPSLVMVFERAAQLASHGGTPELMQAALTEFIVEGHFSRHIKRMRELYAHRRNLLAEALGAYEQEGFIVRLQDGGMHLLLDVPPGSDDIAMAQRARERGFGIHSLSAWRRGKPGRRALMLGFTNVISEADAQALVKKLMHAFKE